MAEFNLKLRCDNDAFDGRRQDEIAAILRNLARRMEGNGLKNWALFDSNGNRCGIAELTSDAYDIEESDDGSI